MPRRIGKTAIILALACSIGLHWAFLQSLAWAGMVLSYSQELPLKEALAKTFDGDHPCCLCKEIAKAKHSEKKPDLRLQKLEFCNAPVRFVLTSPVQFWRLKPDSPFAPCILLTPPTPPPRA